MPSFVNLLISIMPTTSPFLRRRVSNKVSRGDNDDVDSTSRRISVDKCPGDADGSIRPREEVVWGKTPGGEGVCSRIRRFLRQLIGLPVFVDSVPCAHDS